MNKTFRQNQDILLKHLRFIQDYNKKVNLTSIEDFDAGVLLHIEDSLAALQEVQSAPEGLMADIGSGGGFPGIPLALASGRTIVLIESIQKKAAVLQEFIELEGLEQQISISALRSEEVAKSKPEKFAVITARAVSELPVLVELAAPLLCLDGLFVALKGMPSAKELERSIVAAKTVGLELITVRELTLSDGITKRTIATYQKVAQPSITLPRRPGMANKRPLA